MRKRDKAFRRVVALILVILMFINVGTGPFQSLAAGETQTESATELNTESEQNTETEQKTETELITETEQKTETQETETPTGGIEITAADAANPDVKLAGVQFKITDKKTDKSVVTDPTDEEGIVKMLDLKPGEYFLEQEKTLDGYEKAQGYIKAEEESEDSVEIKPEEKVPFSINLDEKTADSKMLIFEFVLERKTTETSQSQQSEETSSTSSEKEGEAEETLQETSEALTVGQESKAGKKKRKSDIGLRSGETVTFSGVVTWEDGNDKHGWRPSELKIQVRDVGLFRIISETIIKPDQYGVWRYAITAPKYNAAGELRQLRVETNALARYRHLRLDETNNDILLTIKYSVDFNFITRWIDNANEKDKRPEFVTLELLQNGEPYKTIDIRIFNNNSSISMSVKDIPIFDDDFNVYKYELKRHEQFDGYISDYNYVGFKYDPTEWGKYTTIMPSIVIYNYLSSNTETTSISGSFTWNDGDDKNNYRPANVSLDIYRNGELFLGNALFESGVNAHGKPNYVEYKMDNLPKYDESGKPYVYTVDRKNMAAEPYRYIQDGTDFVATFKSKGFTIFKYWHDDDDRNKIRPQNLEVELYRNGEYMETITVKPGVYGYDIGSTTKAYAPVDEKFDPYVYQVKEIVPPGYSKNYTIDYSQVNNIGGWGGKSNPIITISNYLAEDRPYIETLASLTSTSTTHINIKDIVTYEGLEPGVEYVLKATLMDKDKKAVLIDALNRPVPTQEKSFKAEAGGKGQVEVDFSVSYFTQSLKEKASIVVFQKLYKKSDLETPVVVHENYDDEKQTVELERPPGEIDTVAEVVSGENAEAGKVKIKDTITLSNLKSGMYYYIYGTLMDKKTGKPFLDAGGNPIQSEELFQAKMGNPGSGTATVETDFSFDSSLIKDKTTLVVFQEVYFYDDVNKKYLVAAHNELEDKDQTVELEPPVPEIRTKASEADMSNNKTVVINDIVSYKNLEPGKQYSLVGSLMDQKTGGIFKDKDGRRVESDEVKFTADDSGSGSQIVTFTFGRESLTEGTALVCFQYLYKLPDTTKTIATHEDINDENQTVVVNKPILGKVIVKKYQTGDETKLIGDAEFTLYKEDGTTVVEVKTSKAGEVLVFDNLEPGKYILKETKAPPGYKDPTWKTEFEITEQTLEFTYEVMNDLKPEIATTASEVDTSDNKTVTIKDIVTYKNLEPGVRYILYGKLMDKSTGKELAVNYNFPYPQFTADVSGNGEVEGIFTFDRASLTGKTTIVVFETLYKFNDQNTPIAEHEDINDQKQTVEIEPPEETEIEVIKKWIDDAGHVLDPDLDIVKSITVELLANGKSLSPLKTLVLTKAGGWRGKFTKLPKTSADGKAIVYTVKETAVTFADGQSFDYEVEIGDPQDTTGGQQITVTNKIQGKIIIHKVDEDGNDLAGVEFTLQEAEVTGDDWKVAEGGYKKTGTTDQYGKLIIDKIPAGNYLLTETKGKEGHQLLAEPVKITIPYAISAGKNGNVSKEVPGIQGEDQNQKKDTYYYQLTYTILNNELFEMPASGGTALLIQLLGIMLLLGGGFTLWLRHRRIRMVKARVRARPTITL